MLKVVATSQYKRDYRKLYKSGQYNLGRLDRVIDMLAMEQKLPTEYRDHALKGDKSRFRECHVAPDWVLVYEILNSDVLVLSLVRTGSHSDLLSK